jgi:hypothetical protein
MKKYTAGEIVDARIWDARKEDSRALKLEIGARVCDRGHVLLSIDKTKVAIVGVLTGYDASPTA